MGVYDRQAAQALRHITAKGEACTWNQAQAPNVVNQAQPWIATDTEPQVFSVAILWTANSSNPLLRLIAGTDVESGSLKGIMHSVSFTPSLSDTVTRSDGSELQIVTLEPVAPNGQVIMWRMSCKQGQASQ